MPVKK